MRVSLERRRDVVFDLGDLPVEVEHLQRKGLDQPGGGRLTRYRWVLRSAAFTAVRARAADQRAPRLRSHCSRRVAPSWRNDPGVWYPGVS